MKQQSHASDASLRIMHTADWHLGKTLEGRSREQEQIAVLNEICQIADEEMVDIVIIAGDIYQTVNPPAFSEELFYETIQRLSNFGKRAVIAIAGNHDQPERIRAANPLADKQGIYLYGLPNEEIKPTTIQIKGTDQQVKIIRGGSGWFELILPTIEESVNIITLPYPSESRLRQMLAENTDVEIIRNAYSNFIGEWFQEKLKFLNIEKTTIAISHLFVQGGKSSESETEIQLGGAYTVEPSHLPLYADYVALGHLHRPQFVKNSSVLARYSGSPLAYSFSEANQQKSVTIVEISLNGGKSAQKEVKITEVPLTQGNSLIRESLHSIAELEVFLQETAKTAWLDLELHVPEPLARETIQRIRSMHTGLINLRVITPSLEEALKNKYLFSQNPEELFKRFYQMKNNTSPRPELIQLFLELLEKEDSPIENE